MMKSIKTRHGMIIVSVLFLPVLFLASCLFPGNSRAADASDAVNKVIDDFQDAYSSRNIVGVQTLFHPKAVVAIDFANNAEQRVMMVSEWAIATKEVFKEHLTISDKLTNREINVYRGGIATVVCDYDYRDPASHQTGNDVFTLIKIHGKWKIVSLVFSGDAVGERAH